MSDRRITATRKDDDGDITHVCNSKETWGPRASSLVITDIEAGTYTYYVENGAGRSDVNVVQGTNKKFLRTDPNGKCSDNLDDLPDC